MRYRALRSEVRYRAVVPRLSAQPRVAGGPGSGNFGHAGRPGEIGGSSPGGDREDRRQRRWEKLVTDIGRLEIHATSDDDIHRVFADVNSLGGVAPTSERASALAIVIDGLDVFESSTDLQHAIVDGLRLLGGSGSGNHGHRGRPGEVGDLAIPKGAIGVVMTGVNFRAVIHLPECKHGVESKGRPTFPVTQEEIDDLEDRGIKIEVAPCARGAQGVTLRDMSEWRVARRSSRVEVDPIAARWVRRNGLELADLSEAQRDVFRGMIAGGLVTGQSESILAGRIARQLEPNTAQDEAIANFVARLRGAQGGTTVENGLLSVRVPRNGLTDSQVRGWADRYERRLLLARAQSIVSFELRRARSLAQLEIWRAEDLPSNVERVWHPRGDSCPVICDEMVGTSIGLFGVWELPDGREIEAPPAHPHCDCYEDLFVPRGRG